MQEQDLFELLEKYQKKETEILEFKEWKNSIPFANGWKNEKDKKKCVYGYCVGIGNERGGKLLIGVKDNGEIIWTNAKLRDDAKQWIYEKTGQKIEIFELSTFKGKVIVINIPSCRLGQLLKFNGIALMRVDDGLTEMDDVMMKKVLNEGQKDWSGLPCIGTNLGDLDDKAVDFLKEKKAEISKDDSYKQIETKVFLNQMSLLTEEWIPNNTCILFLGKQEIAERKLPAISRIIWYYVDEKNNIEDRLTAEQQRSPLILTIEEITKKIKKYNFQLEDISLFRQDTEYQYEEKAIEEIIANSLAHRDWEILLPNNVEQTPEGIIFSNPGVFENDLEKVIEFSQNTPYKNQIMADFLSKINLMENERRGLQKVFQRQLSKWVFVNKKEIDNQNGWIVRMILDWKIKDKDFAKFVLQVKNISRLYLFLLQKIAEWKNIVDKDITKEQAEILNRKWYIELFGKFPNRKCRISYDLYKEINQEEKYILSRGIGTKKKEKLILEFIEKKGEITTQQVYKLFPEANKSTLRSILNNMKGNFIKSKKIGVYDLL